MRRLLLLLSVQLIVNLSFSQTNFSYTPPIKIPILLSGNFGEIRSDHFHSGIDIKTQGATGHHVFAVEEAYVSRIKVQANGYGKSIYLAHPNGTTSVYGHLDKYREDIADYTRGIQYKRKSHQVDIYLEPGQFELNKGDFIAYSGNSGGSFGPHLHFEIRNSGNQHPVNALRYGFGIKDNVAPKFLTLFIESDNKRSYELLRDQGVYTLPWGTTIESLGPTRLGVEVFDYLDGAPNRCGVYSLEVYVDNQLTYSHVLEEFSFSETRYINAHIDYEERISSGKKVHRLYRLPNDKLRIYGHLENNGILNINENSTVPVRIVATDVAGNRSELVFKIEGKSDDKLFKRKPDDVVKSMKYNEENIFEMGKVKVEIPVNSLYENLDFRYSDSKAVNGSLTGFYNIHDPGTPVHRPYILSVEAPEVIPEHLRKLIFITYDEEEGKNVSVGGTYNNGRVSTSLREFGSFSISLDTIPPVIIPKNGKAMGDLSTKKHLEFTVIDDLSDIDTYEGYIDNQWVLFEYDPKNDLLTYSLDDKRVSKNQSHELELYVTDSQGNVNLFHSSFTW